MAGRRAARAQPAPLSYLDMPVRAFLDALSGSQPAPAGGSLAALTVTMAAGLCMMAASLSAHQLPQAGHVAQEAHRLRDRAAPLAEADAEGYRKVLEAMREPAPAEAAGQDADPAARQRRIARALSAASTVPMAVAEIGERVAALAADVAADGNPNVRGDAVTAALLAAAGARAAAVLVRVNLAGADGDDRPRRAERLAAEAGKLAAGAAQETR